METITPKPIHGERGPLWQRLNMREHPPVSCEFRIGDCVEYTNDNGVKFVEFVIGFAENTEFYGRFIYITPSLTSSGEPTECWWFAEKPSALRRIATSSKLTTHKYTVATLAPANLAA